MGWGGGEAAGSRDKSHRWGTNMTRRHPMTCRKPFKYSPNLDTSCCFKSSSSCHQRRERDLSSSSSCCCCCSTLKRMRVRLLSIVSSCRRCFSLTISSANGSQRVPVQAGCALGAAVAAAARTDRAAEDGGAMLCSFGWVRRKAGGGVEKWERGCSGFSLRPCLEAMVDLTCKDGMGWDGRRSKSIHAGCGEPELGGE